MKHLKQDTEKLGMATTSVQDCKHRWRMNSFLASAITNKQEEMHTVPGGLIKQMFT